MGGVCERTASRRLAKALREGTVFTREEFDKFGLPPDQLKASSYIEVNGVFYKPAKEKKPKAKRFSSLTMPAWAGNAALMRHHEGE